LAKGVMRQLELNRLLFGSATVAPDARTAELLEALWPERSRFGSDGGRILLLARVRLLVSTGHTLEARRELADGGELYVGHDLESRLLRAWAQALDPISSQATQASIEVLLRMDHQLASFKASLQKK
nr:hypothetical protein [Xanthomonadales bacterium]